MKYPYAVVDPHPKQHEVVFFDIFTEYSVSVCIPVKNKRDEIRKILNPHYMGPVVLHQKILLSGKDKYVETENLSYKSGKLYYFNQSMRITVPFTEANRKSLQDYDFKLEYHTHMNQRDCCTLY